MAMYCWFCCWVVHGMVLYGQTNDGVSWIVVSAWLIGHWLEVHRSSSKMFISYRPQINNWVCYRFWHCPGRSQIRYYICNTNKPQFVWLTTPIFILPTFVLNIKHYIILIPTTSKMPLGNKWWGHLVCARYLFYLELAYGSYISMQIVIIRIRLHICTVLSVPSLIVDMIIPFFSLTPVISIC